MTATELGHDYLVLTDHSPRLRVANGLSVERLTRQLEVVEAVDGALPVTASGCCSGIEVDILDDGALDQTDAMLERLDVVVASVHSKLAMDGAADDAADGRGRRAPAHQRAGALHRPPGHGRPRHAGAEPLRRGRRSSRRAPSARRGRGDQLPPGALRPARRARRAGAGGRLPVLHRQRRARAGTARLPRVRRRAGRAARRTAGPDRHHLAGGAPPEWAGRYVRHMADAPSTHAGRTDRSGAAPVVEVRRSGRRRRTVAAYREDDRVVVLIPARFTRAEEREWVATMLARLERSERRRRPSDDGLARRAAELSERYLEGRAVPATVRWVDNQNSRWGSCTPGDRSIRLSTRLRGMPGWVIDYVLVHELAHLIEIGHTARVLGVGRPLTRRPSGPRASWRASPPPPRSASRPTRRTAPRRAPPRWPRDDA